jgi:NADH-ubiquinone oxidoreductase chain 2
VTRTLVAISANSWFTAWLALEINLISIIPLILNKLRPNFTEAAIKYFLAQALASIFLIFPAIILFANKDRINLEVSEALLATALALKAGIAPLHFWFPQVIINLS